MVYLFGWKGEAMEFRIEFMRTDGGNVRVTLQDGPLPELNSSMQDESGTTWFVAGIQSSEVVLRPSPLVPSGTLPKGAKLQRVRPLLRVAQG